jgi:hypothetical protein
MGTDIEGRLHSLDFPRPALGSAETWRIERMEDESDEAEGWRGRLADARQRLIDLGWTEDELDDLEVSDIFKYARNRTPPPPRLRF